MKKTVSLEEDVRQVTAGTEYNMSFEDARMQAVIQRVEQKFNVTVGVSNPRINNCLITADLTDQSLQKTLAIISTITPIKYELNKNNMVTLRGDGCN